MRFVLAAVVVLPCLFEESFVVLLLCLFEELFVVFRHFCGMVRARGDVVGLEL